MKKKILIICAVVVVAAVVLCGVLGVCLNLKDKPIFKTEIDGIVYEMDYDYYSARNDLTLNNDEYKYSILTEVKLSIKNNNSVQFSFQPQLFSLDIGNGYICDFESVKNTATNEIITDKNEVITITAGSQIVFEFTFRGEI